MMASGRKEGIPQPACTEVPKRVVTKDIAGGVPGFALGGVGDSVGWVER